ncbi:O-antigen ligase family protein [Marinobacter subterrani]|uniref:O-antigen ligase family protein n=1 Tax=Marinobacter subterrani TaxID=1658765 RepID=UPI002353A9BB|nr:O-antigen ligase family protein [Marinobacter subterrani]
MNYTEQKKTGYQSKTAVSVLTAATILAFAGVLFSDFLPGPFGGYANQRLLLVLLSGFLVVSSVLLLARSALASQQSLAFAIVPAALLAVSFPVLSLSFSGQPFVWVEPAMYAVYFMAIGLAGLCLAHSGSAERYAALLVSIAAVGCFFYGGMTINVYLFTLTDKVENLVNFIPWGFVNIRYWSHIATWLIPLLPLAVLVGPLKRHRLWRFAVALGAGIWWWVIFLSAARGSALGILFGTMLALVLLGRHALPWFKVFLQYLVTGAVLWLVLSVLIPSLMFDEVQIRSIQTDSSGRLPLFVEAWQMSLKNFPFGMGPQAWLTHEPLTEGYRTGPKFGHPHNMYLMWAAEYGWILLLALAVWAGQAIRSFWRKRAAIRSEGGADSGLLLAGFTASVSAALFHAGVSAVFMAPGSMLVGLFVFICFFGLIQTPVSNISPSGKMVCGTRRRGMVLVLVGVLSVTWLAWAREVWQYHQAMIEDQIYYQEHALGGTLPRFWFHGNFPRRPEQMPRLSRP